MSDNRILTLIKEYRLPIIPISKDENDTKKPLIYWTEHEHTTRSDYNQWITNFTRYNKESEINWALKLGRTRNNNLLAIDIDGTKGIKEFKKIVQEKNVELPNTWEHSTPSGYRYIFSMPMEFESKKHTITLSGKHNEIAFICDGSLCMIPPSKRTNGKGYFWTLNHSPKDIDIASCPDWILNLVNLKKSSSSHSSSSHSKSLNIDSNNTRKVIEGSRNNTLTKFAGNLLANLMMGLDSLKDIMRNHNDININPPLSDTEVDIIATSIYNKHQKNSVNKYSFPLAEKYLGLRKSEIDDLVSSFSTYASNNNLSILYDKLNDIIYIAKDTSNHYYMPKSIEFESFVEQYLSNHFKNVTTNKIQEFINKFKRYKSSYLFSNDGEGDKIRNHIKNNTIVFKDAVYNIKKDIFDVWDYRKHYNTFFINGNIKSKPSQAAIDYWNRNLAEWLPNESTRKVLQEYIGYCLTNKCDKQKALFLYGEGSNGKSLFIEGIKKLFYGSFSSADLSVFNKRFGINELHNKSMLICADIDSDYIEKSGTLKSFVAGEVISAEVKYKETIEFIPTAKLLMSANELPKSKDKSKGLMRRLILVHFDQSFPDNPNFLNEYMDFIDTPEGIDTILHWAFEGLLRLNENNKFTLSQDIENSKKDYKINNDSVFAFVDDNIVPSESEFDVLFPLTLYNSYLVYSKENNTPIISKTDFIRRITNVIKDNIPTSQYKKININTVYGRKQKFALTSIKISSDSDYLKSYDIEINKLLKSYKLDNKYNLYQDIEQSN